MLITMSATPSPKSTSPSSPARGAGTSSPAKTRQAASDAGRAGDGYETAAVAAQIRASSSSA